MDNVVRILIVEDLPSDADLAKREITATLASCAFEVVETREDYLAAIERFQPDLITSDYKLPHFNGLTALRLAQEHVPMVPFIILTGSMNEETAVECMKAGATDYVIKEHIKRLGLAVVNALEQKKLHLEKQRTEAEELAAQVALRESEARYRSLFENMLNGFAYHRMLFEDNRPRDFIYLLVNNAFEQLTGLKDVVGKRVSEVIPGIQESDPELLEVYGRVALTGIPERFETYVKAMKMWFSVSVYSPQKEHFVAIFDVITERKRAEEELRKSEERFRQVSASMIDVSYSCVREPDGDYVIDWIAGGTEAMVGYSDKEIHALGCWGKLVVDEDHVLFEKNVIGLAPGDSSECELRLRKRDGNQVWITSHAQCLLSPGDPTHPRLFGGLVDITKRKRLDQEMAALGEQLRQSQKMEAIGQLAGGIAHDFNNLLTVIQGYAQISLMDLQERDPLRANIEEIREAAKKAADLTRQLLAFSRKQILEMRVLDLNQVLQKIDKMLRRMIGEDIELVTVALESLGKVKADPGQIEQVIFNLAINARDAMPEGGKLTIETGNVELDEEYAQAHVAVKPGRYVMLSMSDTGTGMTSEVRERIFEPFFSTKEKGKGTGLGLSTVYGIVKQSGGNIWVYSEPGQGTTFKIYLPRVEEALDELREEVVKEISQGTETILIVEDEQVVRKLAVRVLKRQGYKILEAPDGGKALMLCEDFKEPIHLILTDVVMPGMSGRKLVDRIKEIHPEMKVLYMSGYTDNAILHHGVLEPGTNFIQKPFTVDGLPRKVREVLDE